MYKIIRKHELVTTTWSGGTTTQLAIWPPQSDYAARNFTWRVSTARVDVPQSEFTRLPDISRILMVLEGTLRLQHEDGREVTLNRFDQDCFDGGQHTVSYGQVQDFNLMMKGCTGWVEALELPAANSLAPPSPKGADEVFCALAPAQVVLPDGDTATLDAGDVLLTESRTDALLFSGGPGHMIRAVIYLRREEA